LATASREEVRWLVTQALAQLRADDRVVLDLRFVEELPFAVIGTILGISEVAATSRYRRALARLRDLLPAAAGIDLNS
jgi:RNA polymerase sigma factor (sigma-70 family)